MGRSPPHVALGVAAAFLVSLAAALPTPASAATLFADGFESGSLAAWTVATGSGGSAVVQQADVASGASAAALSATTTKNSFAYARATLPAAQEDLTTAASVNVIAEGAANSNVPLLRFLDTRSARVIGVYRQNASGGKVYVQTPGGLAATTGVLPLATWAGLRVRLAPLGPAAGTLTVTLNDVVVYSTTTADLGGRAISALQIGNEVKSQPFSLRVDDVTAVNSVVDTSAPDTTISAGPTGNVTSPSAEISFSATEAGSTFECSLDAAAWTGCTSPASFASLSLGEHSFQVRATDPAGNTDATPAALSWTVVEGDTAPPDTVIDSGPSGSVSSTTASFAFSATETGSTFECSLDSGAYTACTSPRSYSGLSTGGHTFSVRATDLGGNTDPSPAARSWNIVVTTGTCDTAAPVPSSSDPGTVLVADNFENTTLAGWKVLTQGDATVSSQTTNVRSGRCAVRVRVTRNVWDSRGNMTQSLPADTGELWASGYFTVETPGVDTGWNVPTFRVLSNGKRVFDVSRQNGDGNFFVRWPNPSGGWSFGSTGRRLNVGQWYHIKIHLVARGNVSLAEVWLDGSKVFSSPSVTLGVDRLNVIMVGAEHQNQEGVFAADDVLVKTVGAPPTSTVFSDGFESGTLGAFYPVTAAGTGTATAQSSVVRSGAFAARLTAGAEPTSYAFARRTFSGSPVDLTATADVRVVAEGNSGASVPLVTLVSPSGARLATVARPHRSGGPLLVQYGSTWATTSGTLPFDTWGQVAVRAVTNGAGASTVEAWLDGVLIFRTTTASLGTSGSKAVQIGAQAGWGAFGVLVDDVSAVAGTAGPQVDPRYKLLIADSLNKRLVITDFDGRVVWSYDNPTGRTDYTAGPIGVRWMTGNRILATFGTGEVGLIDVATKSWVWKTSGYNGDWFQSPYDAELLPDGNLAVALRFNNGGRVSVYNRATGQEVWRHYLGNAHSVHFRTAEESYNTDEPTLLVGGFGSIKEVTYNPNGGQSVAWQVRSEYTHEVQVVEDGKLLTAEGYYIQKIDRAGVQSWKRMTPDENRRFGINPISGGGYIFTVAESDRIEFRDRDGYLLRDWSMLSDGTGLDYPYGMAVIEYP